MRLGNYLSNGSRPQVDFDAINSAARACLHSLLRKWLPSGRLTGREYVALNPHRTDRHLGSFRINVTTGAWGDFATKDRGGDPVSLAAYLAGSTQVEAALQLATTLGIETGNSIE